jgi:hypothetical protein
MFAHGGHLSSLQVDSASKSAIAIPRTSCSVSVLVHDPIHAGRVGFVFVVAKTYVQDGRAVLVCLDEAGFGFRDVVCVQLLVP